MQLGLSTLDYSEPVPPDWYRCDKCGITGVKLWREYQTFLDKQILLCLTCSCQDQEEVREPTEDGKSLYTDKVHHWYRTANMEPDHWIRYDPSESAPADATEVRSERERTVQIGWLVPAVPTEEGDTFWGYTSVPDAGCEWWYRLPAVSSS